MGSSTLEDAFGAILDGILDEIDNARSGSLQLLRALWVGLMVSRSLTRQSVNYLVALAAERAELAPVHPHMLRHSCGFYLANRRHGLSRESRGHERK